jgi:hypothetical protein
VIGERFITTESSDQFFVIGSKREQGRLLVPWNEMALFFHGDGETESVAEPHRFSGLKLKTEEILGIYTRRDKQANICRVPDTDTKQNLVRMNGWFASHKQSSSEFSYISACLTTHKDLIGTKDCKVLPPLQIRMPTFFSQS